VDFGFRADAQDRTRLIAKAICRLVADWVLIAYGALEEYRQGGVTHSASAIDCVKRMLKGEVVTQETSGLPNSDGSCTTHWRW